ncbi:adenylate kinase [Leptothoe kymatousa]|uniref:Adenylate kinase n=1 Tax=Leptothoe kymatousa TAU-MAC 1615 TaxID=2364775 RepID=A0ABS5Y5U1_9CYAN|nr:adenylate kinase [Leptothoe kymatousa]MBT9312340.1 adenylate kinase [Leptothoe kymatousa TAU-MAC 1615]
MIRIIFLGPPGAGKGTQAAVISEEFSVPHISTGDILRAAVAAKTELGQKAATYMDAGELVPDDLILDLIRNRLNEEDASKGWILDGFPRNVSQANFLDKLLAEISQPCECVLNLEVPDDILVSRLLARGRKDDNEDVIRNRLEVYRQQTEPLIEYFRNRQQLVSINGHQPMDAVAAELKQVLQA